MRKSIFMVLMLMILFSCNIELDKNYEAAGYVININSDETITFCGLENSWGGDSFYVPSSIYGKSVTKIAYNSSATWAGCSSIYIPSTVTSIEPDAFKNNSSNLSKIYWDKSGVTYSSVTFLPNGVSLYAKTNGSYENVTTGTQNYTITYVTDYGTAPSSKTINVVLKLTSEHLPVLIDTDYIFDGWYIGVTKVTEGYTISEDTTLSAKWRLPEYINDSHSVAYNDSTKALIFDLSQYQQSGFRYDGYSNGVLTIHPTEGEREINQVVIKGNGSSSVISGLCIRILNDWVSKPKIKLENIVFETSKSQPLIDSAVDILIEYQGYNQLSSSANDAVSLIKGSNIEFKAINNSSKITLKTNTVKNSTQGSIGIEANKVTINGGIFVIEGSDGLNYDANDRGGKTGRQGSSGIKASETIIKNNATVSITAGNGGNGSQGQKGDNGNVGWNRDNVFTLKNAGNGDDGKPGKLGGTGGLGGTAIKGNLIVESGDVTLFGGNGGSGGIGGEGGNGGKGGDNWAANYNPGNGGKAGDGGQGGTGGNGGDAISGTISGNAKLNRGIGGAGGGGGNPGTPGEKGYRKGDWGSGYGNTGNSGNYGHSGNSGNSGVEHR